MTTTMTLPMAELPKAISESVAITLRAHGLSLSEGVLGELGRNATQALFAVDESMGLPERPTTADLMAVGQTLRALAAMGRPNPDTAQALGRVGDWLAESAKLELAKKQAA